MDAIGLLLDLENAKFDLTLVSGKLRVTPADRLTPAQEVEIRRHRDELIGLVQLCEPAPEVLSVRGQDAVERASVAAERHDSDPLSEYSSQHSSEHREVLQ